MGLDKAEETSKIDRVEECAAIASLAAEAGTRDRTAKEEVLLASEMAVPQSESKT